VDADPADVLVQDLDRGLLGWDSNPRLPLSDLDGCALPDR
jgi:hypothetical protein